MGDLPVVPPLDTGNAAFGNEHNACGIMTVFYTANEQSMFCGSSTGDTISL